ncbi:MAG: hypothetical protein GKR94_15065 [Gammaproteobacteria bacterium]|nr:hypothetical protein [Gammaproteobacteria bacterium]
MGTGELMRNDLGDPNHAIQPAVVDWTEFNWEDLVSRLALYAAFQVRKKFWRGHRSEAPGAWEPMDLVHIAIEKTLSGQRKWDSSARPLFEHLTGIINSEISHRVLSKENQFIRPSETVSEVDRGWYSSHSPDELTEALSEQQWLLAMLDALEPRLAELAHLMIEAEIKGSAELSRKMNLTTREVNNLKKRLRRAAKALLEGKPVGLTREQYDVSASR